jgi:hypothetical protein
MQQQSYIPSSNGLQSFAEASPDYELAPIGIASMHEQAQKLAEYGRNGDIYVVHAAEGETVIPLEVLNKNPKIKELLFKQMEEMGLDPQEFVVGNELNSINPDTGLPEFFFKSVFRAVKKAVKSVVKVVKKAAPIVLPIAAAAFGVPFLGPAFGAGTFGASFLGSGIGTLVGGGSVKDALKSGLISGGLAGLTSGFTGSGSFGENLTSTFTGATPVFDAAGTQIGTQYAASPFADALGSSAARQASAAASKAQFSNLFSGDPLSAFTGEGTLFGDTPTSVTDPVTGAVKPGFVPTAPTAPTAPQLNYGDAMLGGVDLNAADFGPQVTSSPSAGEFLSKNFGTAQGPMPSGSYQTVQATAPGQLPVGPPLSSNVPPAASIGPTPQNLAVMQRTGVNPLTGANVNPLGFTSGQTAVTAGQQTAIDSAAKATMDAASKDASYFTLGLDNKLLGGPSITTADITNAFPTLASAPSAVVKAAASNVNPGLLEKAVGPLTLAGGAAYLGGSFDPGEVEQPTAGDLEGSVPSETGYDLFQKDPQKYLVQNINPHRYDVGNPVVPTQFTARSADGGYMQRSDFPRREMLVQGPGTERSDDIPAMLSDGEFVMNAKAVRGADPSGNGNRQAGAANLYNMMRNFEMRS